MNIFTPWLLGKKVLIVAKSRNKPVTRIRVKSMLFGIHWTYKVSEAARYLKNRNHIFYTKNKETNKLTLVHFNDADPAYLSTNPNSTELDNIVNLPEF